MIDSLDKNQVMGLAVIGFILVSGGIILYQISLNDKNIESGGNDFTVAPDCSDVEYSKSSDDELKIRNIHQLQCIESSMSSDYVLVKDIDATVTEKWNDGSGFESIGNRSESFSGDLDGNSNSINGLYMNRSINVTEPGFRPQPRGIFVETTEESDIHNLQVNDVYMRTNSFISTGVIVSQSNGDISNVTVNGEIIGHSDVGGIAGSNSGEISDVYVNAKITGNGSIGGVSGHNSGTIKDSNTDGVFTIDRDPVSVREDLGGITGLNDGIISKTYSKADISGDQSVGGITGTNMGSSSRFNSEDNGLVEKSYHIGDVDGQGRIAGIAGSNFGDIKNVYSIGSYNGTYEIAGIAGYNNNNISNAYAVGSVMGEKRSGGVVGSQKYIGGNSKGTVNVFYDKNKATDVEPIGAVRESSTNKSYQVEGLTTSDMKGDNYNPVFEEYIINSNYFQGVNEDYPVLSSLDKDKQLGNR